MTVADEAMGPPVWNDHSLTIWAAFAWDSAASSRLAEVRCGSCKYVPQSPEAASATVADRVPASTAIESPRNVAAARAAALRRPVVPLFRSGAISPLPHTRAA